LDEGPKGKKYEKSFFKVKEPKVKECRFQQNASKPWQY
jgi:hypothetical protein